MYRHPKENLYFGIAATVGILIWLVFIVGTSGSAIVFLLAFAFMLWFAEQFLKAALYGDSIQVSPTQFPEIHNRVIEMGHRMGLDKTPKVFILNGQGVTNALAVKVFSGKYIILFSDLIDKTIYGDDETALDFIIAHELAHHKMGHLSLWKTLLIKPANFIPFLGVAYSRACEYTADGVGRSMTSSDAGRRSLTYICSGSEKLSHRVCPNAFENQENEISSFFGFFSEILSTHPRTTRRIRHLDKMK